MGEKRRIVFIFVIDVGEAVVNVQKLESMAPEFQNMTEAFKTQHRTSSVLPSILVDKDGQPSPPKVEGNNF